MLWCSEVSHAQSHEHVFDLDGENDMVDKHEYACWMPWILTLECLCVYLDLPCVCFCLC